jgi:hypothetical protein
MVVASTPGPEKVKQEQGTIVAHGKAHHLLPYFRVHDINQFISWLIAFGFESRHITTQVVFKMALRAKDELANPRVKSVSADNEIEVTRSSALESYMHCALRLINPADAIAENRFNFALNFVEDGRRKVTAAKANEAAVRCLNQQVGREPGDPLAASVDNPYLLNPVSLANDFRKQTHAVSDVETGAPEIDNIATRPQLGRPFHDRGRQSVMVEPVGESRSSDPSTHDQDFHAEKQNTPFCYLCSADGSGVARLHRVHYFAAASAL